MNTHMRGGTTDSNGDVQRCSLGARTHDTDENQSVEKVQEEERNQQHTHDEIHPPLLRKKKSSYDLRDIFHHQEAEANQSNFQASSPLATKSPLPDTHNPSPDVDNFPFPDTRNRSPSVSNSLWPDASKTSPQISPKAQ